MPYLSSIERLALKESREEGRQEGIQRGIQEERKRWLSILERQIIQRFGEAPEWARTRLYQAEEDALYRWGERLITADSLEAVFDEH